MTTVQEFDLELSFPGAKSIVHFDDDQYHGGSTVQRVDFIAEYDDQSLFIEIKDPDIPTAQNLGAFVQKLNSGKLVQSLAGKFRDTLFFRSAQGKNDRSIRYLVLLSMNSLDDALLIAKQDELRKAIPISHADWSKNCAASCIVLNFEQWRRQFGEASLRRISEATD
ncbi:hypothetical protein [Erythrobacter litoralis]|uniref:Uncharacterized protein n=1 Tax=Erythrobacter litoralis (strain HTCC2594) TaxID=314225 RepID=Q2N5K1_ERYLH|nr:hypothetical protein [Erythrobacter litoralis]ABC65040.1 hypothetical protein ELI_14740 [Erythrobacter litoralis HTCC2594]